MEWNDGIARCSFGEMIEKFAKDLQGKLCIEILFGIKDNEIFNSCWMGKMPAKNRPGDLYWLGLTEDGQSAYDFDSFERMSEAKVFNGKSLHEVWESVEIFDVFG